MKYRSYELSFPIKCPICGKEIRSKSGFGSHIKNQHKETTYVKVLKECFCIDLVKMQEEWDSKAGEREEKRKTAGLNNINLYLSPKDRMTEKQYTSWRQSMSGVFSLEWFIGKFGKEEGIKKHKERSKKISKTTYFRKYNKNNKECYSKISQELFWNIYKRISFKNVYFAELNHEYGCETNKNFDFVIKDIQTGLR